MTNIDQVQGSEVQGSEQQVYSQARCHHGDKHNARDLKSHAPVVVFLVDDDQRHDNQVAVNKRGGLAKPDRFAIPFFCPVAL